MRLEADAPELEPSPGRPGGRRFAISRLREPLAVVFQPVRRTPVAGLSVLVGVVAVGVTAAYSLLRVGGPGAFDSIWAEDGANFLSDAYLLPWWETVLKPLNGYFVVLPRGMAEVAASVPVVWGPAVLSVQAAVFSAGMAVMVYVASGNVLTRPFLRVVAAAWVVAAPLAESTLTFGPNMVAPLQFVELYGLFWALVWTPVRPTARAVQLTFVVLCCLSTLLAVFFIPVAAIRLWTLRTKWSALLLGLLVAGGVFQAFALLLGLTTRGNISHPRFDPLWALGSYAGWGLPFGVVGERTMSDPGWVQPTVHSGGGGFWYWSGVAAAWVLVLAVLLVAWRHLSDPQWTFAAIAGGSSVLLLCGQIIIQGKLELRYAYTPSLLLIAALLALLRPVPVSRHDPRIAWAASWVPAMGLLFVLVLSAGVNYRMQSSRTISVPWRFQVAQSTTACRSDTTLPFVLTYSVPGWFVVLPCDRLR